ncbi:glycosyltransferase family 2 protein [Companilactobacillus sp. DQM5]|uniref:glycosyltransferase family 2 protein n=1 Tax=Companilactobacillus sp. DQM5 TaxID=3463359 RepID=UPI004059146F
MQDPKVSIIVLNYNNALDTINCLKKLRKINYKNYKVIVVDNHSTDESLSKIEKAIDKEYLIKSPVNGGYAKGNNLGIKYALEINSDYICVLNNDVDITPNLILDFVSAFTTENELGIAGPVVCDYDKRNLIQSAGSKVNMNYGRAEELYKGMDIASLTSKYVDCDYVSGSCLFFKKEIVEDVGYIPEEYFLFYEENEWCMNARKKKYKVRCITNIIVWHRGSHTINQITGLSEYFMYRNLVIFIKKNGTVKNKLIFNTYFLLFCIKSIFTKKNGIRFLKYYIDGLFGINKYKYLQI